MVDDIQTFEQKIAEFNAERMRRTVDDEIKRALVMGGGMQGVANAIYAHQNIGGAAQQSMGQGVAGNVGQCMPQFPSPLMGGAAQADYEGEHVTDGILKGFELKDKATYDFAIATAQLLGARIRASWSPNRSPRCAPRKGIVWQLFNHNWMVDVQWVGDATGGSEDEWTKQFAELADLISEARNNGDKQYGDEPERGTLTAAAIQRAQSLLGQMSQNHRQAMGQSNQALSNQMQNALNQHAYQQAQHKYASLSGNSTIGGAAGAGGDSSQIDALRYSLGMGS